MQKQVRIFLMLGIVVSTIFQKCYAGSRQKKFFPDFSSQRTNKQDCAAQEQQRLKLATISIAHALKNSSVSYTVDNRYGGAIKNKRVTQKRE